MASTEHTMAEYSRDELRRLSEKAERYVVKRRGTMEPCTKLIRDKTVDYYKDILTANQGIMKPYAKDNHGDPRSPINVRRLDGLFFGVSCEDDEDSIYGNVRFSVPATELVDERTRLYFTDFYCVPGKYRPRPHYVTLVAARKGSDADKFCRKHLLPVDKRDNPFFIVQHRHADVVQCDHLHVELYYVEELNMLAVWSTGRASLSVVKLRKGMTGSRHPKRKSPRCKQCNLD